MNKRAKNHGDAPAVTKKQLLKESELGQGKIASVYRLQTFLSADAYTPRDTGIGFGDGKGYRGRRRGKKERNGKGERGEGGG